jgi:pseudaminic acid synthase
MTHSMFIGTRRIAAGSPVYIVAEMSANHGGRFDRAARMVIEAQKAGADAVKLQTYTADTMTLRAPQKYFRIRGTLWRGQRLHDLYKRAATPWQWHPKLKKIADRAGIHLFSSPFDASAVDFLENLRVPVHKVASFEIVDIPLLKKIGATGKPVIMSTGMATLPEIREAVAALRRAGTKNLALLKCTSSYPAPASTMNLNTIPDMSARFKVPVGLSDHTLGIWAPAAAVAVGACIVEKHFILSRTHKSPDSAFSLEPRELKDMVAGIRGAEAALGRVSYDPSPAEAAARRLRRSLFIAQDVREGDIFTETNVRSVRPGDGLHTRHYGEVLGRRAARDAKRGTPLSWDLIASKAKKR